MQVVFDKFLKDDKDQLLSGYDEDEHLRDEGEGSLFHGI